MKLKIPLTVLCICLVIFSGLSIYLENNTVSALEQNMREKYSTISDYKIIVNTTYGNFSKEYIREIKKPDKIRFEYRFPSLSEGDLIITNGNKQWFYDASNNIAYQENYSENIGIRYIEQYSIIDKILLMMDYMDVSILGYEVLDGKNTTIIEFTPRIPAGFSKWVCWLENETLFPLKWEQYGHLGNLEYTDRVISYEENINLSDAEFLPPPDAVIDYHRDFSQPGTLLELEAVVGFPILFPTYFPPDMIVSDPTWMWQRSDFIDTVRITYPDFTLQESLENVFEQHYGIQHNISLVTINNNTGKFFQNYDTDISGDIFYVRNCLSWNIEGQWFFISASAETLTKDEMVAIAESILPSSHVDVPMEVKFTVQGTSVLVSSVYPKDVSWTDIQIVVDGSECNLVAHLDWFNDTDYVFINGTDFLQSEYRIFLTNSSEYVQKGDRFSIPEGCPVEIVLKPSSFTLATFHLPDDE